MIVLAPIVLALSLAAQPAPYAPEEQMDFNIEYLGIRAGKARIAVGRPEGGALPVVLLARTTGLIGVIDVREQLSTVLDVDTGLPRSFQIDAVEPGYRSTDIGHFDRASNKATVRQKGKYDNTYEIDAPPGTVDFIGMVFLLRTLPLEPGSSRDFPVLLGRKVKQVTATVEGRENISTPAGKFDTIRVRVPTGLTGKFSEKNPTYVWFSDDARRVVVRISTDFAVGRAKAELTGYQPGKAEPAPAPAPPAPPAPRAPGDRAARR